MSELTMHALQADIVEIAAHLDTATVERIRLRWEPALRSWTVRAEARLHAVWALLRPRSPRPGDQPPQEIRLLWNWRGELLAAKAAVDIPPSPPPTTPTTSTPPVAQAAVFA